ncbi:MAG: aminopeptidase P family protein [Proteobacteria bacterium]|nr:aminopeptidase P family protein [Pseudomonadota bacterium]
MPILKIEDRLEALREEMKKRNLDGFVVPLTDEHASEYVASYAQRLAWITGFTGSAGFAVVMADQAAIFVDGRYTIQVNKQVDPKLFEICGVPGTSPLKWLGKNLTGGRKIGYDPFLHTIGWVKEARTKLAIHDAELVLTRGNPIDAVWDDQPGEPNTPVHPHDVKYAGLSHQDKRKQIAAAIRETGAEVAIITQLDSIAWLFNIRSNDVLHTPVSLAYTVLDADGKATLYIDDVKVNAALKAHLGNEVGIAPKSDFLEGVKALGKAGKKVLADPNTASSAIFDTLKESGARIIKAADPCALPKARKNGVELNGTRATHIRDGAAVANFLHWISLEAPKGQLDEMTARDKLLAFRKVNGDLLDLSFDTISAFGPNGAICHYKLTKESNLPIKPGSLYLVDSGGQYLDGTTDITRTVPIGEVGDEEKDRFTRVLKGHIALATAKFPKGTTGPELDSFARRPLWEVGLDYDHGTGHGVGCFLAVHEGPGRIAKVQNTIALEPGMIYSNEPGYYKAGEYGIRIENLIIVQEEKMNGEQDMLGFETLTFCPIDKRLVKTGIMTGGEINWLNDYHAEVWEKLNPLVAPQTRDWLKEATAPITG